MKSHSMPSFEAIKSVGRTLGILGPQKANKKNASFSPGRRLFLLAAAGLLAGCSITPKEKARLVNGAAFSLVSRMRQRCQDAPCKINEEYPLERENAGKDMAVILGPLEDGISEREVTENFKNASRGVFELTELRFKRDIDSKRVLGLESCKFKLLKPLR